MASRSSSAAKRPTSGATNGGRQSGRPPSRKNKNITPDLLSKEEEYMRLNAELEERTASLIKEAEEVMQDQEEVFSRPSTCEVNYTEDLDDFLTESFTSDTKSQTKQKPKSNQGRVPKKTRPKSKTGMAPSHNSPDGAGIFQERIALATTISTLEDESRDASYSTVVDDDVLPPGAEDMGSEATIRFLKAKLRVMQEELDRVTAECNTKDEKMTASESKLKELTDEQSRLQKTNSSLQNQIDKYKKLYDETKNKNEGMEQQLVLLRKDLDGLQRNQKQAASSKNATEVRLNRALEEAEKYKTALQKAKGQSKDSSEQERKRVEQLLLENKRLEKQKNELMVGFKKQMKLIDVLKRQKMHIEAAKLLQFSEEEFVKGLDWGS